MNRLLRCSRMYTLAAALLAMLAAESLAQTWTSRTASATSDVMTTSGTSADGAGPSLGNTQSQWTPRFQSPRTTTVNRTQHIESASDGGDDTSLDSQDGAPINSPANPRPAGNRAQQYRQQGRILPASVNHSPEWQRSPRLAMAAQFGGNGYPTSSGQPGRRVAQVLPPGGKGSPFVEDEIVPQGSRASAPEGPPPVDGAVQYQNEQAFDGIVDGPMADGDGCGPGCGPCCDDGCCGNFCSGGCDPMACERWPVCCPLGVLNELSFNTGVQTFQAPVDNGRNGNFGAHLGFNAGDAVWHTRGIGYQVGAQFVESDFYGEQSTGVFTPNSRRQVFITAGLFHRAFYNWGWQGGAVVDYLNDNYYYDATLYQIRGELSFVFSGGREFGSWIAAHSSSSNFSFIRSTQTLQPLNLYTFFYRRTFANGTQGRVWAGFTDPAFVGGTNSNASAILGADYRIVLSNRLDFTGVVNYLPSTQGGSAGQQVESWAMSMNLVFYPARYARGVHNGPYRPLFNVADNSTFFVVRKP